MFALSVLSSCFAILAAVAALGTAITKLVTTCVKNAKKKNNQQHVNRTRGKHESYYILRNKNMLLNARILKEEIQMEDENIYENPEGCRDVVIIRTDSEYSGFSEEYYQYN